MAFIFTQVDPNTSDILDQFIIEQDVAREAIHHLIQNIGYMFKTNYRYFLIDSNPSYDDRYSWTGTDFPIELSPTIHPILEQIRKRNPNIEVIQLTEDSAALVSPYNNFNQVYYYGSNAIEFMNPIRTRDMYICLIQLI